MPDLVTWLSRWRYVALAAVVLLGNVGLPVPEETALIVAGYLVRDGHLALGPTLTVGIASAVAGDNLGYWLGRRRANRSSRARHTGRMSSPPGSSESTRS